MDDDMKLPPLPRLQVPLIDCDPSLADIRTLVKWCERVARAHANAAILADREAQKAAAQEPVAWLQNAVIDSYLVPGQYETCDEHSYGAFPVYAAPPAKSDEQEEVEEMRARKNAAYLERNQVVAALAKCFPSGTARTAIEGWSEEWHGCVYIDLPTGQASWHYHDSHAHLFADLPPYTKPWDGHTTDEKYARLARLEARNAAAQEPIGYLPAYELDRLKSGHSGNLRSARFGPSQLDGDVPVYAAPPAKSDAQPAAHETQEQLHSRLDAVVSGYIANYEFRGDDGDHTPNEGEAVLIEDAIQGLLVDDDFIAAFRAATQAPAIPAARPRMFLPYGFDGNQNGPCYETDPDTKDPDAFPLWEHPPAIPADKLQSLQLLQSGEAIPADVLALLKEARQSLYEWGSECGPEVSAQALDADSLLIARLDAVLEQNGGSNG